MNLCYFSGFVSPGEGGGRQAGPGVCQAPPNCPGLRAELQAQGVNEWNIKLTLEEKPNQTGWRKTQIWWAQHGQHSPKVPRTANDARPYCSGFSHASQVRSPTLGCDAYARQGGGARGSSVSSWKSPWQTRTGRRVFRLETLPPVTSINCCTILTLQIFLLI